VVSDTTIHDDDDEIVAMIKELLETRIRPAVQEVSAKGMKECMRKGESLSWKRRENKKICRTNQWRISTIILLVHFMRKHFFLRRFTPSRVPVRGHPDDSPSISVFFSLNQLLPSRHFLSNLQDGGDIFYVSWDEGVGEVRVQLAGSCSGCPSSSVTLKSGVENMLMHYIPEVR